MAEQKLASYISGLATGQYLAITATGDAPSVYPIVPFWSNTEVTLPAVIIKAGKFTEEAPDSHVYEGEIEIGIATTIDCTEDPKAAHDAKVMEVYGAMVAPDFLQVINSETDFHAFGYYSTSYDQDADARVMTSTLTYKFVCQSLGIS